MKELPEEKLKAKIVLYYWSYDFFSAKKKEKNCHCFAQNNYLEYYKIFE